MSGGVSPGLNGGSTGQTASPLGGAFSCLRALAALRWVPSTKDSAWPKQALGCCYCPMTCYGSCVCLGNGGGSQEGLQIYIYKYQTP